MVVHIRVKTLDGVPESIRGDYKKKDDGWYHLDLEDPEGAFQVKSSAELSRMRNTMSARQKEARDLQNRLRAYQVEGEEGDEPVYLDPEEARSAITRLAEIGSEGDVSERIESEVESRVGRIRTKMESDLTLRDATIEGLRGSILDSAKRSMLRAALGNTADNRTPCQMPDVAVDHLLQHLDGELDSNHQPTVWVKDLQSGGRRISAQDGAREMVGADGVLELVDDARKDSQLGRMFAAPEVVSPTDPPRRGTREPARGRDDADPRSMSGAERIRRGREEQARNQR